MCCKGFVIVLFVIHYFAFGQFNINDDCRSQSDGDWPYSYNGTRHTTVTGNICKNWSPDHSTYGPYNYCRALRGDKDSANGPWCYLNGGGWEYCYIPVCDIDCQVSTTDRNYRGLLNVTSSGLTCKKWSLTISPYNYEPTYRQNETLNFCRTPTGDSESKPWCYTTSKDKKWENCDVPLCSTITGTKCPDLRQKPNMISPKRLTGYFYQAQVAFQCDRGYSLSSAGSLTCQASSLQYDGHWSGIQPSCLRIKCPNLHQERNMISPTNLTGYLYKDQVAFRCAEGYSLSSVAKLTCLASSHQNIGYWSRNQPRCLRIKCPDLHQERNMISPTNLTGYVYQDQVTFRCAEGYSMSSVAKLICLASSHQNIGYWSRNQPRCLRIKCPDLHQERNMISPTNLTGHVYQDQVAFRCAEGYSLSSVDKLTCLASSHQNIGYWSRNQPSCLRIKCPDLHQERNMISPTNLTGYVYQDQVAFRCAEGYSLSSVENMTCLASSHQNIGYWSKNQPSCLRAKCPDLSIIQNLKPLDGKTTYRYGERVILTCETGYRLIGSKSLTCQQSGLWNDTIPDCQGVPCPPLPKIDKALLQDDTREYRYPETLNVTCETGFKVEGSDLLRCNSTGFWSYIPQCSCKEKSLPYTDSGERNGVYISYGLFGGVLAAIVMISTGIHIGTCFYYRKRLRKHVTVYEDIKFNTVEGQNSGNEETYTELT